MFDGMTYMALFGVHCVCFGGILQDDGDKFWLAFCAISALVEFSISCYYFNQKELTSNGHYVPPSNDSDQKENE